MKARRPAPPSHLSPVAREEWARLAPEATGLTAATARGFALLVELLATERAATEVVASEGVVVRSAAGTSKPNPAVRSLEIARSQAVPLLRQFGLLPPRPGKSSANPIPKMNGKSPWHGVLK